MPAEEEILRYKLDISDIEAKAARLNELVAKINKTTDAGEKSKLTGELGEEVSALAKFGDAAETASDKAGGLLKQKDKLGQAAQLLGSNMGPLIGNLGGVAELFTNLSGPTGLALVGTLGLVTKLVGDLTKQWKELEEQLKRAEQQFQSQQQSQASFVQEQSRLSSGISQGLQAKGAFTPGNLQQAIEIYTQSLERGVPPQQAAAFAPTALLQGLSAGDVATAVQAGISPQSTNLAQQLQALSGNAELQQAVRSLADTPGGLDARVAAARVRAFNDSERELFAGTTTRSALARSGVTPFDPTQDISQVNRNLDFDPADPLTDADRVVLRTVAALKNAEGQLPVFEQTGPNERDVTGRSLTRRQLGPTRSGFSPETQATIYNVQNMYINGGDPMINRLRAGPKRVAPRGPE